MSNHKQKIMPTMMIKRYVVVERDARVYPPVFHVFGAEITWDTRRRFLLKTYKTFRGADRYASRLLAAPLRVFTEATH